MAFPVFLLIIVENGLAIPPNPTSVFVPGYGPPGLIKCTRSHGNLAARTSPALLLPRLQLEADYDSRHSFLGRSIRHGGLLIPSQDAHGGKALNDECQPDLAPYDV